MADVEFFGAKFGLNPDVSEFALMEFAEAASDGQDGDMMEGLASTLRFVRECVAPKDRARFNALARKKKAGMKDLMPFLQAAFGVSADRPTGRSSDLSDGPEDTPLRSVSNSAVKVSRFAGRPDLQLMAERRTA